MAQSLESLPIRSLRLLAGLIVEHPRWFLGPQLLLAAICVGYTVLQLGFTTDRNALVGKNKEYHQIFLEFKEEFAAQNEVVVIAESGLPEKNREFVERLAQKVRRDAAFTGVFYRVNFTKLGDKALHFLPPAELAQLSATLKEYKPFIEQISEASGLASFFNLINREFRKAEAREGGGGRELVALLPSVTRIVRLAHAGLSSGRHDSGSGLGLGELLAGKGDRHGGYVTLKGGRFFLLTLRVKGESLTGEPIKRLRDLVRKTKEEVPGVNAGITGEPVLEYEEMVQARQDMLIASVVSLVLVSIIFIFGYHETQRPIKATLSLVIGLAYTMGYTTLMVGHLNILTITFAPILIGLAIDLGVHLITRYEEGLRVGTAQRASLEKAMVETGRGIFTGALTTAGAFFAMALTDFKGIQEMGVITGGGMLICLLPMMTFLPSLLLRERLQNEELGVAETEQMTRRARIERWWLRHPQWVLLVGGGITVVAALQARHVYFDYNLLHMQTKNLPAVRLEKKLIRHASKSALYGAVVASSLKEARELEHNLTNLTTVASVDSMTRVLSESSESKKAAIREVTEIAESIRFRKPSSGAVDLLDLRQALWGLSGYVGLALDEVDAKSQPEVYEKLAALSEAIRDLRRRISQMDAEVAKRRVARFEESLFGGIRQTFKTLREQQPESSIAPQDLPGPLQKRFVGKGNQFLLQVYPKSNIWERVHQKAFVQEIRSVDPEVTGTPVQLYEYTTLLRNSYIEAAYYALGAITLLVLLHFRSIVGLLLALLPVGIGSIWLVGLMGVFGIPFNPANIMTLPLVIGIGVANGIHILNRFQEEGQPGILAKSTGKAVLVSGLTTMAGFASLTLAQHRGIASLGVVMSTGVAMVMLVALAILPSVLVLLQRRGWSLSRMPTTK